MSATIQYNGTGRRKEAVRVNDRAFDDYFPQATLRMMIEKPLALTETREKLDVIATIAGGGPTGQAGAMRLGIARALLEFDASLRPKLKVEGLLTRDAREVERKKYGQPGARKRFQFSKR
jgi:small subunit ribosomal protein S9